MNVAIGTADRKLKEVANNILKTDVREVHCVM
jgi:hypothetical protein